MTQDAIVVKLLPNDMAEVVVTRTTACGSNCGNCESCIFQSELKTIAKNNIAAKPGQRVVIASSSRRVFSAAALVYLMPLFLFLAGYLLASMLGATEGICILVSFSFLFISAVILVLTQRKIPSEKQITYDIIA